MERNRSEIKLCVVPRVMPMNALAPETLISSTMGELATMIDTKANALTGSVMVGIPLSLGAKGAIMKANYVASIPRGM
jgi:hypothetical protein